MHSRSFSGFRKGSVSLFQQKFQALCTADAWKGLVACRSEGNSQFIGKLLSRPGVEGAGVYQHPIQIEERVPDHSSFRVPEVMRRPLDRSKSITLLPVISSRCLLPMVNRVLPKTTPVSRYSPMRTLTVDSMPVGMAP